MKRKKTKILFKLLIWLLGIVGVPLILMGFLLGTSSNQNLMSTSTKLSKLSESSIRETSDKLINISEDIINKSNQKSLELSNKTVHETSSTLIKLSEKSLTTTSNTFQKASERALKETGDNLIKISQDNLKQAVIEANKEKGLRIANNISGNVLNTIEIFRIFSQLNEIKKMDVKSMVSILGSLQKSNKEIQSISVINTSGDQVLKISGGIVSYSDSNNHLETPEVARAMSGKLSFSNVKSSGRNSYININIPIQLYVGKYVGVFSTNLSLASVYDIVNSTKIGNKGFVFITDNSGRLIFHPAAQANLGVFARQARAILKTAKKSGTVNFNNVPMLVTAVEDSSLNWDIFSVQPEAEAFQSASEMKNQVKVQTAKSLSSLKTQASQGLNSAIKNMETQSGKSAENSKKIMLSETEKTLKMTTEQLKPVAERNTTDTVSQLQKQSTQEARTAQGKIAAHSTALIIIFIAIAGVIAVYIAKGFVNPIQKITNIAKIMSNDDLTAQIDDNEQDEEEIDELYKSFSKLQQNLKKRG